MKFIILILFLIFVCHRILSLKFYGDYYIENEGLIPATFTGDPVSYRAGLTRSQYNKLITLRVTLSRKVGPIGLHIVFQQKDGTEMNQLKIPNLCEMEYPLDPFTERFSGKFDENCCLEAGKYTLTNWTLEDHMRPKIPAIFYGKYTLHLRLMENNQTRIMEFNLVVEFKDRENRKIIDDKSSKDMEVNVGNKNQKKKSKGKSNKG